jgi:hypothetical protein
MTKTNPRRFTDYDAFALAFVVDATLHLPAVSHYDSFTEARAKAAALRKAAVEAEEAAREEWQAHIEHMEELYERGVGPAWA